MFRKFMLFAAIGVLAMSTFIAVAQDDVVSQEVIVTYTDEAITVSPAEIPSGLTTFVMDNQTERHVGGPVGRFKDGMTMEDLLAATQENPFASILVFDLVGSLSGLPDTDQSLTVDLQPGDYVFISSGNQMGNLAVTESDAEAVSELEHDVEVIMSDFAYEMPDVLTAGEQIWQVHNDGEQIHEFLIIPVEAETTLDDATEMFRSMGSIFNVMSGESPIDPIKIWGPISPGYTAWVPISLEPGTYAIGGLLPDITTLQNDGPPTLQLDHGMVALFSVE